MFIWLSIGMPTWNESQYGHYDNCDNYLLTLENVIQVDDCGLLQKETDHLQGAVGEHDGRTEVPLDRQTLL